MKTITMILSVCLLAACSACDETGKEPAKPERIAVTWLPDGTYRLVFRFDAVPGFEGLVDEKTLDSSTTHNRIDHITEYFHVNGWTTDIHHFTASHVPGIVVEGLLYGADVVGANLNDKGFGVLPGNADGSFLTDIDPAYPAALTPEFFAEYPIAGQIIRHDRANAIPYRTEAKVDGLLVTWNGVDHWFSKS